MAGVVDKDDALFIQPEPGVHDGCFLYTKPRCPIKFAQWQAMIEALPVEPSAAFQIKDYLMGYIYPVTTGEEWQTMIRKIREIEKRIVVIGEREDMIEEMNALAKELYGDKWEVVLSHNAERMSGGETQNANELTDNQIGSLIASMKRLKSKIK